MEDNLDANVSKFIEDPNTLISICDAVLKKLLLSLNNEELTEKHAQLIEVSRSIDQLSKLSIAIPDELRKLKISLVSEIEYQNTNKEKLVKILDALKAIVEEIGDSYWKQFPKKKRTRKRRSRSNSPRTKQDVFRPEIIDALKSLGGSGTIKEVMDIIEERVKDDLKPGDFEKTSTGDLVWKNNVHWARNSLREDGIIRGDSPRGVWELAEDYK